MELTAPSLAVDEPLDEPEWRARQQCHAERVEPWIRPRLERRQHGSRHPVDDFLFDYYSWRPAQLARWHPGAGIILRGDVREVTAWRGYVVEGDRAWASPGSADGRVLRMSLKLLVATASRPASFGCFGRHEWAMVYRQPADRVRHAAWPLRLPTDRIADVVETAPLRCTHFDAFRFYTDAARPLNSVQPTRGTQVDLEQPGCLHATMDLYKWAFRCYPVIGADLTADCFELAREVRAIDMRASPYDLAALGYPPIAIETAEGRAEYLEHQRCFADRGNVLRHRLIDALRSAGVEGSPA